MAAPAYRVDVIPRAEEQLRELAAEAKRQKKAKEVATALQEVLTRLEDSPLDFGEPLRNTAKEGGVVRHAIVRPVSVHFAVYAAERVVLLLEVKSLSFLNLT
jgi:hypothetical protein